MYKSVESFMDIVNSRSPGEKEFHQAVHEVVESIWSFLQEHSHYFHSRILETRTDHHVSGTLEK